MQLGISQALRNFVLFSIKLKLWPLDLIIPLTPLTAHHSCQLSLSLSASCRLNVDPFWLVYQWPNHRTVGSMVQTVAIFDKRVYVAHTPLSITVMDLASSWLKCLNEYHFISTGPWDIPPGTCCNSNAPHRWPGCPGTGCQICQCATWITCCAKDTRLRFDLWRSCIKNVSQDLGSAGFRNAQDHFNHVIIFLLSTCQSCLVTWPASGNEPKALLDARPTNLVHFLPTINVCST